MIVKRTDYTDGRQCKTHRSAPLGRALRLRWMSFTMAGTVLTQTNVLVETYLTTRQSNSEPIILHCKPAADRRHYTRPRSITASGGAGMSSVAVPSKPLPAPTNLRAILFDVDGTLTESDPIHLEAFQEILSEVGFNDGKPIDEEFFRIHISGRHNPDIAADLFPSWTLSQQTELMEDKEARFRKLAANKLQPVKGLPRLCAWIEERGLRRVAVTNAPRANAEQMLAALGLTSFFEYLIIGSECERAKPFPDPYLLGLEKLGVKASEAFAVEDSPAGMRAAVAAGLPCVGVLTSQQESIMTAVGASFSIKDYDDPDLWKRLG